MLNGAKNLNSVNGVKGKLKWCQKKNFTTEQLSGVIGLNGVSNKVDKLKWCDKDFPIKLPMQKNKRTLKLVIMIQASDNF